MDVSFRYYELVNKKLKKMLMIPPNIPMLHNMSYQANYHFAARILGEKRNDMLVSQVNSCCGINLQEMCELLKEYIIIISSISSSTHFLKKIHNRFLLAENAYICSFGWRGDYFCLFIILT